MGKLDCKLDELDKFECKFDELAKTATSFFLPHQNLAKSHHLSSGAKDSKPLKYINTDIREQNIYDYD